MNRTELEIKLERLDSFSEPKPELEQYQTPPSIAADLLWSLYMNGELEGKKVVDLGCGTGLLAIGAKLLGAGEVVAVDKDREAIRLAEANARSLGLNVEFVCEEIENVDLRADLVLQNPPFGSQEKGSDRPFLEKALEVAPIVYSFHMKETDGFVRKFVESLDGKVVDCVTFDFPLKRTMPWHEKEKKLIEVNLYSIERK
ncbi:MAG: METTL5 family protein [Candidatus Aenigmatarchaeota archaeon]